MKALRNGHWLTRERIVRVAALCGLASVASILFLLASAHGTLDYAGRPLGTDFSNVWTAGRMALHGHAADAWVNSRFIAEQHAVHGPGLTANYIWVYPPPFMLIAALLATLPYLAALIVWQLGTIAPFTWLMHRLIPRRETLLLTLAAPITLICLMHGQNGFLTALLLGGGLTILDRRPFLAGLLFGCLIYKPQFGLILPILLIAARNWRAVVAATLSATVLVAVTLAIWGWAPWAAFFANLPVARDIVIEQGATGWEKMMSPFGAIRLWGGSIPVAYAVQAAATGLSGAAVAWIAWTRKSPELRNALVCAAALISTPYVFDYDFVVLLPAIAFILLDAEQNGWLSWEKSLLALAWIGSLPAREIAQFTLVPLGLMIPCTIAAITLRRASRHRHSAVHMQHLPGDVTGFAAGEKDAGRANILA